MRNVTIISTGLGNNPKSHTLAVRLESLLQARGTATALVDVRSWDLPHAGAPGCWDHPGVAAITAAVADASHVVISTPVYCYDANSAAKNVIELCGRAFTDKVVGFVCQAGGQRGYMSVLGLANHMMLDFRSVIVPRYVYVAAPDWTPEGGLSAGIEQRLARLCDDLQRITVGPAPEA